jgi:hypothetical protein
MTVLLELTPELEAGLAALAAEQGVSVSQYVTHLLAEQVPLSTTTTLSPTERAALWRDSVKDLPRTPPLPDAAISRETIYDVRG